MNDLWLIDEGTLTSIGAMLEQSSTAPTKAELDEFASAQAFDEDGRPSNMAIIGDTASIRVHGILTDAPNFMMAIFGPGNTTYRDIRSALAIAEADDTVERIRLEINSPGGTAGAEWVETLTALGKVNKPIDAYVGDLAASAAYGIAAKANTIQAQNSLSRVGSIGTVLTVQTPSANSVTITSSNAPDKRPDVTTEEGRAVFQTYADAVETIFIEHVAEGRGVTADAVRADFGRGGVVLAEEALTKGMIDSLATDVESNTNVATSGETQTTEAGTMDLATLKASHPEVYAQAVAIGEDTERGRVKAHVKLGESSGAMDVALKAIKEGSDLSMELQAEYLSASMNRKDVTDREDEDEATADALDNATGADAVSEQDQVLAAMEADMGMGAE
jgi:ClpP class serine protease